MKVSLLGDINIDCLKVGSHSSYSSNLLLIITKSTRITSHTATLIDNIYTNVPSDQIIPGVVSMDISDHLTTFCIFNRQIKRLKLKKYIY